MTAIVAIMAIIIQATSVYTKFPRLQNHRKFAVDGYETQGTAESKFKFKFVL
jgi:hypothetical protein